MDDAQVYYRLAWRAADATLLAYGFYPTKQAVADTLAEYYSVREEYNFNATGCPPDYMIPHHSESNIISLDIVAIPPTSLIAVIMTAESHTLISGNTIDEDGEWDHAALDLWNEALHVSVIGEDRVMHTVRPLTDEMRAQLPSAQIIQGPWHAKGKPAKPAAATPQSKATPAP